MLGLQHGLAHPNTRTDPPTTPISKLMFVIKHLEQSNKVTTILGAASLAVLIGCRILKQHAVKRPGGRWLRYVPEILLVVAGTTCKHSRVVGYVQLTRRPHRCIPVGLKGLVVLGKVSGGSIVPFGMPLDKRQWKYFSYTVSKLILSLWYPSDLSSPPLSSWPLSVSSTQSSLRARTERNMATLSARTEA
jgi:hypothetical protein